MSLLDDVDFFAAPKHTRDSLWVGIKLATKTLAISIAITAVVALPVGFAAGWLARGMSDAPEIARLTKGWNDSAAIAQTRTAERDQANARANEALATNKQLVAQRDQANTRAQQGENGFIFWVILFWAGVIVSFILGRKDVLSRRHRSP